MLQITPTRKQPVIRFRCPNCSKKHDGFPAIAYQLPDAVFALSSHERSARASVSPTLCTLDGARYFVRSILHVPISELGQSLEFGPWVEVEAGDFGRYAVDTSCESDAVRTLPGILANDLPRYPKTTGIAAVFTYGGAGDDRPVVTVIDGDHQLARDQRSGIDIDRALQIVATMRGFVMLVE